MCGKRLYYHIRVVVCKKPLQRNTSYSKNENILKMAKIGHDVRGIAMQNIQFGSKSNIKLGKTW